MRSSKGLALANWSMRWSQKMRPSGWQASRKHDRNLQSAGPGDRGAEQDQRHAASRRRGADGGGAGDWTRPADPQQSERSGTGRILRIYRASDEGRAGGLYHRPPRLLDHRLGSWAWRSDSEA